MSWNKTMVQSNILRLGIVNRNTSTFGVISIRQQPTDQRCSESRYRPCGTQLRVCCLGVVPGWVYGGSVCSPRGHRGACKEEKQDCDVNAFCGEPISVTGAIALEQAMTFELPEVIAELIQSISIR